MVNSSLQKYVLSKTYNGVNHDIKFYNPECCAANRRGDHFLRYGNEKPSSIIQWSEPLSVYSSAVKYGITTLCMKDGINIDFLNNYEYYDSIIVSRKYAECAKVYLADYTEYLDRLWVTVPLYDRNTEMYDECNKIGCVFVQRVVPVQEPRYYMELIRSKHRPSLFSVSEAINNTSITGKYGRIFNSNAIGYLREYLLDVLGNINKVYI